jgi:hypothetical protein
MKLRALRETAAESCDKLIIAFASFGARGLRSRFWQTRCGGHPEAHEDCEHLDRYSDIALHPRHASVELVEAFRDDGLLAFGGIG